MSQETSLIQQLESALPAYIVTRRWFRAKALSISSVKVSTTIELDGFLILLLTIAYQQGGSDLYLLPVTSATSPNVEERSEDPIITFESPDGDPVAVYDAVYSPFFRTAFLRMITSSTTSSIAPPPEEGIVKSFVSRAEQSNTSIIYGQDYILKLFRKLESGINPDIEVGAFLTSQGFKNTPAMLARLELQSNGETFSAAILQQFVANQGDAWKYTLTALEQFGKTPETLGDYERSAQLLGTRTAQMHIALSSDVTNADFAPETFTERDAVAVSEEITAQARSAIGLLREKLGVLAAEEALLAQRVLEHEAQILQRFSALAKVSTSARRIRYHGDYHLGQVLYTGSDFMIIDFEGEPARPLKDRRTKALALRDVAGMLRSFQYAAYSALPTEQALAAEWCNKVTKLYLDAYFAEADAQVFLPSTAEQRQFFLDAFVLQKALYEVQYELNNRPGWVGIPLRGILSLIEP